MNQANRETFKFLIQVLPEVVGFLGDLFDLFDGDIDLVNAEIVDRRGDIARRRARNDEALRKKHSQESP
jgi:hypothetical protein